MIGPEPWRSSRDRRATGAAHIAVHQRAPSRTTHSPGKLLHPLRSLEACLVRGDLAGATAQAAVPSFVGGTVAEAESTIEDLGTEWQLRSRGQVSSKVPGTVIAQTPGEGTVLGRSRSLTVTVAKKAPPSWKSIFSESGAGSKRTDEFNIPGGSKVRIAYSFTGDTNAILVLHRPGDDQEFGGDLLLNEIGDFSDTTRVYDAGGPHYLEIQGGSWTVDVQVYG